MTKFIFSVLTFFSLSHICLGQNKCNCESNFEWTKQTFEKNDAGFQYTIEQKGREAYETHNRMILAKAQNAKTTNECATILYDWLKFFRKGHIEINLLSSQIQNSIVADSLAVAKQEVLQIDEKSFQKRIDTANTASLEGIWLSEPYSIGIIKTDSGYSGFIIDAPFTQWKKGQVKFKLYSTNNGYQANIWMRDFSIRENQRVEVVGNNYINIGNLFYFKRKSKNFEDTQCIKDFVRYLSTSTPYFQKLSKNTAYIRIPRFDISQKRLIDSVIKANNDIILNTHNLIIDVRNNGGGSDASFQELLPYLYTNPIRTVGVEFLSTELNNQLMLDFSKDTLFSENKQKWFKKSYERLARNLGKFVQLSDNVVSIDTMTTIYPNPANVAILINENNASTTEQFLLTAKQSKKVKLFGTTTFGALDISNMNNVKSPCGDFELWYCMSKSLRIPEMTIDSKGIQPDFYMDKTIAQEKWVDFVREIFNDK